MSSPSTRPRLPQPTIANELIDRFRDTKDRTAARPTLRGICVHRACADARHRRPKHAAMPTARTVVERIFGLARTNKQGTRRVLSWPKNAPVPAHGFLGLGTSTADGPRLAESRARPRFSSRVTDGAVLWRIVTSLAMGDLGDKKRGLPYVKTLVRRFPKKPDILIAAQAFASKRGPEAPRAANLAHGTRFASTVALCGTHLRVAVAGPPTLARPDVTLTDIIVRASHAVSIGDELTASASGHVVLKISR